MTFRINGRRYRLRTDVWAHRLGVAAFTVAFWALMLAPIIGYCAKRW